MTRPNEVLERLKQAFLVLSRREQGLILLVLVLVPLVLVSELLVSPAWKEQQLLRRQLQERTLSNRALQQQLVELEQLLKHDPDEGNRQTLHGLQQQMDQVDEQFHQQLSGLVLPQEMAALLRGLVERQGKLTLSVLQNEPPQPVLQPQSADVDKAKDTKAKAAVPLPSFYRHPLQLKLRGSYLDLLASLQSFQRLPKHLLIDAVQLKAADWPIAEIELRLSTLSSEANWLGAPSSAERRGVH
ncbi:MAG: hypothetical protein JXR59_05775 [Desulfuromonadaceae bacterium]|nr:hypothetical protein [Desulfuromonadaceae bacterium]